MTPIVKAFFDEPTFTVTYVVSDPATKACAIIDSVLDFDPASGRTAHTAADQVIAYVQAEKLKVAWILETHAHADHLTASVYLKEKLGGQVAIGAHITDVQKAFTKIFNLGPEFAIDGRQFDRLFKDGDTFKIGELNGRVMHTPGHTPACIVYVIEDAAFVGDTMFMP
ncbi:MAG: MBL fold metallo-hydrolase, partial [Rhodobacteraceae bacterium]|nr:MBL fold metallo-hydrolase [Paracoccaceae bacterium]